MEYKFLALHPANVKSQCAWLWGGGGKPDLILAFQGCIVSGGNR